MSLKQRLAKLEDQVKRRPPAQRAKTLFDILTDDEMHAFWQHYRMRMGQRPWYGDPRHSADCDCIDCRYGRLNHPQEYAVNRTIRDDASCRCPFCMRFGTEWLATLEESCKRRRQHGSAALAGQFATPLGDDE